MSRPGLDLTVQEGLAGRAAPAADREAVVLAAEGSAVAAREAAAAPAAVLAEDVRAPEAAPAAEAAREQGAAGQAVLEGPEVRVAARSRSSCGSARR